ncbi:MAG: xanthine dehydrogenase family protein [Deltaproteobacteria bacterium]|jgi:xanthine dehydrogenase molybdenum-binding subunit
MSLNLIGKDFIPADIEAKVTGKAKYSEDFRAEGMVFAKLYLSPMPHAKVRDIDADDALEMEGVLGILTADDVPEINAPGSPILTNEPHYVGAPILAIAAIDEATAAAALDKVKVKLQPLPFVTDPLESLYPGGPNATAKGNVAGRGIDLKEIKWSAKDFAKAGEDQLPLGEPAAEWNYGDVEQGFKEAKLVLDETFVTATGSHHSMEPRSSMAYWQNGKCYVHGSTQSQSFAFPFLARALGIKPDELVFVSEFCGGGFGSKSSYYPTMAIAPYFSKKIGRPVMLRISRAEEYYLGSARAGFQARVKIGFKADGRVSAVDAYVVQANGPTTGFWDYTNLGEAISIVYQPENMRWRGVPVLTNTPPQGAMRGPGENQTAAAMEPIIDKAARELGLDRLAIRRINAPDNSGTIGEKRGPLTSAYLKDALDMGAQAFNWEEKKKLSGKRTGSKVIGVGLGQAFHSAGSNGFDGLIRILPDGKLHIHTGIGNLGTYSYAATSRVAAEVLGYNWDNCVIERGDSRKHLPWNLGQFGSNTSFTMSRTNYVAAMDAKAKLLEIAAMDLGGQPEDYELKNETVVSKSDTSISLSFAKLAQRAIELGGKYSGQTVPEDLNPMTKSSAAAVAGTGLVGVAKDNLKKEGTVPALCAGFAMIELDLETGHYDILEYHTVADCGTVIHPTGLGAQLDGGAIMGFGMASTERHVYDPKLGIPATRALYEQKPPTYLDIPLNMNWLAVNKPDPQSPFGSRGVGEPPLGAAASALASAISDALGGHLFNRIPISTDMIVNAASGRPQSHKALQVNTQ